MIAWPIEAALAAGIFSRVIVSTDDEEIAEVAGRCGAEAPFRRPVELADDYVGTTEVIAHAVEWGIGQGWRLAAACCIYATAAFVRPQDLVTGWNTLKAGNWHYAFSATEFSAPIYRAFKRRPSGGVEMLFPEHFQTRSQDLEPVLHDAGQFYWGTARAWLDKSIIFSERSVPLLIPRTRSVDIDEPEDWALAEALFTRLRGDQEDLP
jgi:N-acylneuraminate cytidylyltransferase